ncbi:hypothetical protein PR202_gb28335 [Eleusine coracana subsp. coracana]|uniref:Uncharacterized protein n=1 Tax=Eleusine coracana subsp. coracana TaxID=191504 RepID=A0AAV5FX13_ELECO|nr:hypothetical protein QOZ80_6AG0549460 [Eleusine coracana subsp. coracana]GJN39230.1 hypothetical protein PR202_gb28335 [Eleusine coracana subsp. coracana]
MSVVAAAAVGPAGAAAYGPQLCGSGARKRKDVVHHQEAEEHHHHHHDHGLFVLERVEEEEEEERSSIGAASDQEEGDEADSAAAGATTTTRRRNALACMDALDDALPIKRGLSNFFSGKSRSFASLQDAAVTTAQDLAKPENPFNKRRRVLRCSSIRRVASTPLTVLPPFLVPPAAAGNNDDDAGYSG